MRMALTFVAGVATGWLLRSGVGSLRGLAVQVVAGGLSVAEGGRRLVAQEREYFEDLVAEGRARFEAGRKRVSQAKPRAVA